MSHSTIDALILDALVVGQPLADEDGEIAAETWESLVAASSGTRDWQEAIERRRALDQRAQWIQAHPWLAAAWLAIRASIRSASSVRLNNPTAQLEPSTDLLTAMLGPARASIPRTIELVWGSVVVVPMHLNEIVAIGGKPDLPSLTVRFRTKNSEGTLSSGAWRLEPGDAPVLLQVLAEQQAPQVSSMAGVLLVEVGTEGEAP